MENREYENVILNEKDVKSYNIYEKSISEKQNNAVDNHYESLSGKKDEGNSEIIKVQDININPMPEAVKAKRSTKGTIICILTVMSMIVAVLACILCVVLWTEVNKVKKELNDRSKNIATNLDQQTEVMQQLSDLMQELKQTQDEQQNTENKLVEITKTIEVIQVTVAARLIDVNDNLAVNEGRLEVYYRGKWGTVCDDSFDSRDGTVACRMLGRNYTGIGDATGGAGVIGLDNLACNGRETSLFSCGHNGWGVENCGHQEDVYLYC